MPYKDPEDNRRYYQRNKKRLRRVGRKYYSRHMQPCTVFVGQDRGKATAACELYVRADLTKRGYEVTVPVSPTALHDLHVDLPSVGWVGVQVKAGRLNLKTGFLGQQAATRQPCKSPILALVHLPTNRIEYRPGTAVVPPELTE